MYKLAVVALFALTVAVAMSAEAIPNAVESVEGSGIPAGRCYYVGQYMRDLTSCEHFYQCDAGKIPRRFVCSSSDLCWYQPTLECQWKSQSRCHCRS